MGLTEFVVFASTAMAINALATSIMLSALPEIAAAYALNNTNAQRLVLAIFSVGFSLGQFIVGPTSDGFGRRSALIAGLALYSLASLVCVVAPSFVPRYASAVPLVVGSFACCAAARGWRWLGQGGARRPLMRCRNGPKARPG